MVIVQYKNVQCEPDCISVVGENKLLIHIPLFRRDTRNNYYKEILPSIFFSSNTILSLIANIQFGKM